jgi:hypothetical protein
MLILDEPQRGDDGELWYLRATLELDGLRAVKRISAHYATCMDELIAYLGDLAASWKGWDGTKEYVSLEKDLSLSSRHDGYGHVRTEVTLNKQDGSSDEWSCTGWVTTEPGAQMDEAAATAGELFARHL